MTFTRVSNYHQVSDCGEYTVCWVSGRYEAWHLREQLEVNLETAEQARVHCQAHAAARSIESADASERIEAQP